MSKDKLNVAAETLGTWKIADLDQLQVAIAEINARWASTVFVAIDGEDVHALLRRVTIDGNTVVALELMSETDADRPEPIAPLTPAETAEAVVAAAVAAAPEIPMATGDALRGFAALYGVAPIDGETDDALRARLVGVITGLGSPDRNTLRQQLMAQYSDWCAANGIDEGGAADDRLAEIDAELATIRARAGWLQRFIKRWDDMVGSEEGEAELTAEFTEWCAMIGQPVEEGGDAVERWMELLDDDATWQARRDWMAGFIRQWEAVS